MGRAVVSQRDPRFLVGQRDTIELDANDAAANAGGVLHLDVVARGPGSEDDFKTRPCFWDAWVEDQRRSPQTEPEDLFETCAVHPSGRAGVPGPSAASDMGR